MPAVVWLCCHGSWREQRDRGILEVSWSGGAALGLGMGFSATLLKGREVLERSLESVQPEAEGLGCSPGFAVGSLCDCG